MEENQAHLIWDYFKPINFEKFSRVRRQHVKAKNFELKPALIIMIQQNQFSVFASKNPNTLLAMFLKVVNTSR